MTERKGAARGRVTRLLRPEDAQVMAALVASDRDFQAPYEPVRSARYLSVDGQAALIADLLGQHAAGRAHPLVILDSAGLPVGRITLTGIERGPFLSGRIGYWVVSRANGRGLATAAVAEMVAAAFGELGLHRLEAGTLTDNHRSQRVLEKAGFVRFGMAPKYLQIAGEWRDHHLFQRLATDA